MDALNMWSYEGWKEPQITLIFILCIFIGCAMNFTTLHCTYINSAVTTSFVGVVKSIATITVGMLAFKDVAPTRLFIGGVVVNTVGSIIYCVVKYFETKRKSLYEDLEKPEKDASQPGDPYTERPPPSGEGPAAEPGAGQTETGDVPSGDGKTEEAPRLSNGALSAGEGEGGLKSVVMTEKDVLEMQREHIHKENSASAQSATENFVGVWRSIRNLQLTKKENLIDNMELQSP